MTIAGRDALVAIEPFVDCLLDRHLAATREWFPHDFVPWERCRSLADEPWGPTNSPLTAPARTALELDLLIEDDLLSFHLVLWNVFAGLGAWGGWIRRWTAEEARHSIAIRDYLLVSRVADPVALERERMKHSSRREARHRLEGPLDSLIYATLQELATRVAHCNTAAIAGDPVVERLLAQIAADENLHYAFYRDVVAAALDLAPSAVLPAIRRQVLGFAMPALELRNLRERAASIAAAGIYNLQIHDEQVLCPLLLDHWRLRELRGLDAAATGARDEVLGFLAGLRGSGDETEQGPPLP